MVTSKYFTFDTDLMGVFCIVITNYKVLFIAYTNGLTFSNVNEALAHF